MFVCLFVFVIPVRLLLSAEGGRVQIVINKQLILLS